MYYSDSLTKLFIAITIVSIGVLSYQKIVVLSFSSLLSLFMVLVPACVVMGFLGYLMGTIIDDPKNQTNADYKLAVLNALKRMDKSMTLQELNEKLTKTVEEPDAISDDEDDQPV